KSRRLRVYPDAELRQHVLNAVAVETARGWRLAKEKASRKIDAAVALSFACMGEFEAAASAPRMFVGPPPSQFAALDWGNGNADAHQRSWESLERASGRRV